MIGLVYRTPVLLNAAVDKVGSAVGDFTGEDARQTLWRVDWQSLRAKSGGRTSASRLVRRPATGVLSSSSSAMNESEPDLGYVSDASKCPC